MSKNTMSRAIFYTLVVIVLGFFFSAAIAIAYPGYPTSPTGSDWHLGGYTASHAADIGIHIQHTVVYPSTIHMANFITDAAGTGGGTMTMKLCSDGATCATGNTYATCSTVCTAPVGTITACTVAITQVLPNTTLSWTETAGCGGNDLGGNVAAHMTSP